MHNLCHFMSGLSLMLGMTPQLMPSTQPFPVYRAGRIHLATCVYSFIIIISICSTHKIIGVSTVSRKEHSTAQTRELECTKRVLPQVQRRGMCTCICIPVMFILCVLFVL